jgi:hypothetical protein
VLPNFVRVEVEVDSHVLEVAVRSYLAVGRELSAKVRASLLGLCDQAVCATRRQKGIFGFQLGTGGRLL